MVHRTIRGSSCGLLLIFLWGNVVRILLVEDNPADALTIERLFKTQSHAYELHWAKDGLEALEFLARERSDPKGSVPGMILMDLQMPRMSGLEAVRAIKKDPELRVIPVIMLSNSTSPEQIQASYEAHANCFVQKPATVEGSRKLVQAIEMFWADFAVPSPTSNIHAPIPEGGHLHASASAEAAPQASVRESSADVSTLHGSLRCEEHGRLMDDFAATVKELLELHQQQFEAAIRKDPECNRFDSLIQIASEKRQQAKYAYLRHVEEHGCTNLYAITKRTGK